MSDQAPSLVALDPNEAALAALERALRRAEGFALYLVRCNPSALRRETLGRLRERLSGLGRGIAEIDLDEPITDLLSLLRERVPDSAPPPLAVSVSGLELSIPASTDGGILPALNVQRESLPSVVPCPLLLWLPEYAMQRLIVGAPDFYAWRSAEYQLAAAGPGGAPAVWDELPTTDWQVRNLPPPERERRREALQGMVDELRSQPPSPGRDRDLAKALSDLGFLAAGRRCLDEGQRRYNEALEIAERLGDERSAAAIYHELGIVAQERRRFDEAEKWYKRALAVFERVGPEVHAAAAQHQLGLIAQERRRFDEAEEQYRKSLEITLRLGDEHRAARTYDQLGRIAEERRRFDEAEQWYKKSLEIKERLGNEHGAATTYHQLGRIAEERRRFDEAHEWYRKALAIFERVGPEVHAAAVQHQLGVIAQERRRFDEAEEWYKKSLEIKERLGNEYGCASTCYQLGRLAEERGQMVQAAEYFRCALSLAERFGDPYHAEMVRRSLARVTGKP